MRFQLLWLDSSICQISWSIVYLQLSWRSWSFVYLNHGYSYLLYIVRGNDHTCHILYIMHIHGHCTLMYLGLLYVFVVTCKDWLLYYTDGWMILPSSSSSLHLWDGFYNVFWPSCYPSNLTHQGASVIVYFTTLGWSHVYGLPCPSTDSLDPME